MAKTQYSLSDDPKKLGRPSGFTVTVREVVAKAGAGFVVALTGDIMTMPGLQKFLQLLTWMLMQMVTQLDYSKKYFFKYLTCFKTS